jgi:hypothetical protein
MEKSNDFEWNTNLSELPDDGCVLIELSIPHMRSIYHVMLINKNVNLIGNRFEWDISGKIVAWTYISKRI